jgi:hypothetical protein
MEKYSSNRRNHPDLLTNITTLLLVDMLKNNNMPADAKAWD